MESDHVSPPPVEAGHDPSAAPVNEPESRILGVDPKPVSDIGYHYRDALRLLFVFIAGSEPVEPSDTGSDAQRIFIGEKRAMAIDFLVRYPDYLAHDLLDLYEAEGDPDLLNAAKSIFDNDEPDVRLVAMVRWRRGAFQNIETALAILDSRRLVRPVKRTIGGDKVRHEFLIGPTAVAFLEQAVKEQPSLDWYRRRVELAMRVARRRSGSDLKDAQYEHEEYRTTAYGAVIPSIKERVMKRLLRIMGNGA